MRGSKGSDEGKVMRSSDEGSDEGYVMSTVMRVEDVMRASDEHTNEG